MSKYLLIAVFGVAACADQLTCDLSAYKARDGLTASVRAGQLRIAWRGENGETLAAAFGATGGKPIVAELSVNGKLLLANASPEFTVVSGRRRISNQQLEPLKKLGTPITPELVEQEKWNAFWDAPLDIPGAPGTNPDLPRRTEEVRRAAATASASGCRVRSDGARVEISFDGWQAGIFSGRLVYTIYSGSNLLRQEAVARTGEPSVAYLYTAGLGGIRAGDGTRLAWLDVARAWQDYRFGGDPNADPVPLRARNRTAILETPEGSLAVFPPPHKFFWAREIELNLGYVYYRKSAEGTVSVGVRQAER